MKAQIAGICLAILSGSILSAIAGSPSGTAMVGPTDNSTATATYKVTDTGPGMNARDSVGTATTQPTTSVASPGTSATSTNNSPFSSNTINSTSGNDNSSSAGSSSSGSSASSSGNSSSNGATSAPWRTAPNTVSTNGKFQREKVIDTGNKPLETASTTKAESKDKTFSSGLLDSIGGPSSLQAQKENGAAPKREDSRFKSKPTASSDRDDLKKN